LISFGLRAFECFTNKCMEPHVNGKLNYNLLKGESAKKIKWWLNVG